MSFLVDSDSDENEGIHHVEFSFGTARRSHSNPVMIDTSPSYQWAGRSTNSNAPTISFSRPSPSSDDAAVPKKPKPDPQAIRCVDPDVLVVVGPTDGEQHTFACHKVYLAMLSAYIDAMFSFPAHSTENDDGNNMDHHQDEKKILFPEITPSQWTSLMTYLAPGSCAEPSSVEEALELAEFCNHYQFTSGLALCDRVVSTFMSNPKISVEQKLEAFCAAHEHQLEQSVSLGRALLMEILNNSKTKTARRGCRNRVFSASAFVPDRMEDPSPFSTFTVQQQQQQHAMQIPSARFLTIEWIKKLASIFASDEELWNIISSYGMPDGDPEQICQEACFPFLVRKAIESRNPERVERPPFGGF